MWKELIQPLHHDLEFLAGADNDNIDEAEQKLAIKFPPELRELLLEANGIWASGCGLIWTAERIAKDNLTMRTYPGFCDLYMPFDHLLFIGDDGSGDYFGFRILAGKVETLNVYRWCHENDAREWFSRDLADYLSRALGHEPWYGP